MAVPFGWGLISRFGTSSGCRHCGLVEIPLCSMEGSWAVHTGIRASVWGCLARSLRGAAVRGTFIHDSSRLSWWVSAEAVSGHRHLLFGRCDHKYQNEAVVNYFILVVSGRVGSLNEQQISIGSQATCSGGSGAISDDLKHMVLDSALKRGRFVHEKIEILLFPDAVTLRVSSRRVFPSLEFKKRCNHRNHVAYGEILAYYDFMGSNQ